MCVVHVDLHWSEADLPAARVDSVNAQNDSADRVRVVSEPRGERLLKTLYAMRLDGGGWTNASGYRTPAAMHHT